MRQNRCIALRPNLLTLNCHVELGSHPVGASSFPVGRSAYDGGTVPFEKDACWIQGRARRRSPSMKPRSTGLRRQFAELPRTNEILKAASALFAAADIDRGPR